MLRIFIRKNKWNILMFVILLSLQVGVLSLYDVAFEPILYLTILELFAFLVFLCIALFLFYRKYGTLLQMEGKIFEAMDRLPEFADPMEQKLCDLLKEYDAEYRRKMNQTLMDKQEMSEYYVLWTHQIKTPITSARLLLQSGEHPQNAELNAELFRIEQYVKMALVYAQMNEVHNDLVILRCDVDACIKAVLKTYAKEFIRRKLSVSYEELNWIVMSDEKWLIFVLEQIISNALKYTRKGEISIYRKGEELIIEDTGIGIRSEDLPRIFDKGFTGYNGRADRKSTGIGLYLCAKILQNLSFKIRAESVIGKGTSIFLDLSQSENIPRL